jgi:hypothetical protein
VFVENDETAVVFSAVELCFQLPEGTLVRVPGQIVNQQEGGFFVQFNKGPEWESLLVAIEFLTTIAAEALKDSKISDDDEDERSDESQIVPAIARPVWELIDSNSDVPVYKQLSLLSTREKMKLAKQANQPTRRILIRDKEKRIHINIVQNPKLSDAEMIEYTGIATLSPGAIRWISTQLKFMKLPQVVSNLVSNPMTPSDLSLKLIGKLTIGELRRIAKSNNIRETVRRAARKKLVDRGL